MTAPDAVRHYVGAAAHPELLAEAIVTAHAAGKPLRVFTDSEAIGTWELILLLVGIAGSKGLIVRWELLLPGPRAVDMFLAEVADPATACPASAPPPAGAGAPTAIVIGGVSVPCDPTGEPVANRWVPARDGYGVAVYVVRPPVVNWDVFAIDPAGEHLHITAGEAATTLEGWQHAIAACEERIALVRS